MGNPVSVLFFVGNTVSLVLSNVCVRRHAKLCSERRKFNTCYHFHRNKLSFKKIEYLLIIHTYIAKFSFSKISLYFGQKLKVTINPKTNDQVFFFAAIKNLLTFCLGAQDLF